MSASAWASEKVARLRERDRLARERLRLGERRPSGEDLRANRAPEDLGVDVVGAACLLALDGEPLRLVELTRCA